MRFDTRRPELMPGARVAVPPPPHLRMMHAAMPPAQPGQLVVYGDHQASVPRPPASAAQLVIYGDQPPPVPRPTAGPLPLATGNVHTHAFNFPPPRQFPPVLPTTSSPVLAMPQPSPGVLVVRRPPPPQQLMTRPAQLPLSMAGPGTSAAPLRAPAHPHLHYPPAVVTVPLSAVAGPPPSPARWPVSPDLFSPLIPPPTNSLSAAQYVARLPPPPTADIGGAGGVMHMAVSGPPPLSVMHAVPVNYNVPPPAVPLTASANQPTYVTIAHTLTSVPAPVNVMTAQYSDVYDRQQSFESVGHVQPVHPLPSPDSSDILTSIRPSTSSASEHRHKRQVASPSSPERERDRVTSATAYQPHHSSKKHKTERQLMTLSDKEFDDILQRNKSVSSGAILRAVQDASEGDFPVAIETLVTAISLIKQSKIAADDRCKILISSLQDTLHGIESNSYGSKTADRRGSSDRRSRSRDRDRNVTQASSSRHRSRSDDCRSSTTAETREEVRESRHYDVLASSASSSSSLERRRGSDQLERDRGNRTSGTVDNDLRDRGRERDRDRGGEVEYVSRRERERDRGGDGNYVSRREQERDRGGDGDYVSRSSRR